MNPPTRTPHPPAPDRPRAIWTPATFRARALELMETHSVGWWFCQSVAHGLTASRELAWIEIAAPSATVASALYRVRYDAALDIATCACIAAQRGQPCFHAGVAIVYGREAVATRRMTLARA
ncbi:MAG TPA: hypothetical protein VFQ25_13765 [Ktedonobacterales bacterium]|nr:hypothetical protein [Ktedonobacterales bacterium]